MDFPGGLDGKESACSAGDLGSIPGSGRSPGEGRGYPLQCSCLENSIDCVVQGVTKSHMTEQLSFHFTVFTLLIIVSDLCLWPATFLYCYPYLALVEIMLTSYKMY